MVTAAPCNGNATGRGAQRGSIAPFGWGAGSAEVSTVPTALTPTIESAQTVVVASRACPSLALALKRGVTAFKAIDPRGGVRLRWEFYVVTPAGR
jgi:hypothetical protein